MARLLISAIQETEEILTRHLRDKHELTYAFTVEEALSILRQGNIDAIICSMLFDESRMFDLLRACKADSQLRNIPFISCQLMVSALPKVVLDSLEVATKALGGAGFLDIFSLVQSGREDEIAWTVENYLPRKRDTQEVKLPPRE